MVLGAGAFSSVAHAQSIRDHTRPTHTHEGAVSEAQADVLTLTLAPVGKQIVQTWIRTAGVLDASRQRLSACVRSPDGERVRTDQRVRAFPPDSKSSIYQARVVTVTAGKDCTHVEARLSGPVYGDASRYVMEIIVPLGDLLAIPNEAIIEREGSRIVYVQESPGQYAPREIHVGEKGELYTEVVHGVAEGDQVVTIGSFFVDADYRLKTALPESANTSDPAGDAHQHGSAHQHN